MSVTWTKQIPQISKIGLQGHSGNNAGIPVKVWQTSSILFSGSNTKSDVVYGPSIFYTAHEMEQLKHNRTCGSLPAIGFPCEEGHYFTIKVKPVMLIS